MRVSVSIRVLRPTPKVRQTAALPAPPSRVATTAASVPAPIAAAHDPLLRQGALELRQSAKDVEQQLALRRRRVHRLGQRAERDATRLEVVRHGQQVRQRPPEAVELPDHKAVAKA